MKTCGQCGVQLEKTTRHQRFCSNKCRKTHWDSTEGVELVSIACASCGAAILTIEKLKGIARRCKNCRKKPAPRVTPRICTSCGKEFLAVKDQTCPSCKAKARYAVSDHEAQQETALKKHSTIPRECKWCGRFFVRSYKSSLRSYCCEEHRTEAYKTIRHKSASAKIHKGGVSKAKRMRIWLRDSVTCQLCGKKMRMDKYDTIPSGRPHPLAPTVDHIVPVSIAKQLGWAKIQINAENNLQAAHFACNVHKGNRSMGEQLRLC